MDDRDTFRDDFVHLIDRYRLTQDESRQILQAVLRRLEMRRRQSAASEKSDARHGGKRK